MVLKKQNFFRVVGVKRKNWISLITGIHSSWKSNYFLQTYGLAVCFLLYFTLLCSIFYTITSFSNSTQSMKHWNQLSSFRNLWMPVLDHFPLFVLKFPLQLCLHSHDVYFVITEEIIILAIMAKAVCRMAPHGARINNSCHAMESEQCIAPPSGLYW